jgi:hypothetical protein
MNGYIFIASILSLILSCDFLGRFCTKEGFMVLFLIMVSLNLLGISEIKNQSDQGMAIAFSGICLYSLPLLSAWRHYEEWKESKK